MLSRSGERSIDGMKSHSKLYLYVVNLRLRLTAQKFTNTFVPSMSNL